MSAAVLNIPNFRLLDPIGKGGAGAVYLAEQLRPHRKVAIKVVAPESLPAEFMQVLKEEGEVAAKFDHDNILTVYECGIIDDHYYQVMPLLSGGDLEDRMAKGLASSEIIDIVIQAAAGLGHIHRRGYVHRDIKPGNILFDRKGRPLLVDFGIAKAIDSVGILTQLGYSSGTPSYMSPEQILGKPLNGQSDLYSLGIVFYELLTGQLPFSAESDFDLRKMQIEQPAPPLSNSLSPYQPILDRLLAKKPGDRYANAQDLIEALGQLSTESEEITRFTPGPGRDGPPTESDGVSTWFRELSRRRVFRTMALYLVTAWGITEALTTVSEHLHFAEWTRTSVVVLFIVGFPIAMVLSWLFDIGPDGVRRTRPSSRKGMLSIFASIAVMIAVTGLIVLNLLQTGRNREPDPRAQTQTESVTRLSDTIAVMPFVNMSSDPEQEYFSDGISEELLNLLARVPELRVISRSSSFSFKGTHADIPTIASKLNVAHVLEGSVRKDADRLRITVQLIEVRTDTQLWSESYDRTVGDIFEIQNEISTEVVNALKITLLKQQPAAQQTTREVHQLVLQANYFWKRGHPGDDAIAHDLYQRAIDADPGYAPAWVGLSATYALRGLGQVAVLPKAREAAEMAISLDPGLSEAHVRIGQALEREDRLGAARKRYEQALAVDSNNPTALGAMAKFTFEKLGQLDEALRLFAQAELVDPLNPSWPGSISDLLIRSERLDEAEKAINGALQLSPDGFRNQFNSALISFLRGRLEEALELFQSLEENPHKAFALTVVHHALDQPVESDAALKRLASLSGLGVSFLLAEAHAYRGETDESFKRLGRALPLYGQLKHSPFLDTLHDDLRWDDVLRKFSLFPTEIVITEDFAGTAFEEAEALFRQDPRWLGSDGANSTPLGNDRIFWSFEDTFIATSDAHSRMESTMIRNSIAIQTGREPTEARMNFYWRQNEDGAPASFFPENGDTWYWTGGAIRLDEGPIVTFLLRTESTPGQGLGFRNAGYAIAIIDDPDNPPAAWEPRIIDGIKSDFDAVPGSVLVREGDHIVSLAVKQEGTHAGALVRYLSRSLAVADLSSPEWWAGEEIGWVAEHELGPEGPAFVIDDAGAECSVHWDDRTRSFIHIATYGFGKAWIGMRKAPALTGPWTRPLAVYRPPELDRPNPLVYGAIAHPELIAPNPDELLVTYATNSFQFEDLFTDHGRQTLYWPRVITVRLDKLNP